MSQCMDAVIDHRILEGDPMWQNEVPCAIVHSARDERIDCRVKYKPVEF